MTADELADELEEFYEDPDGYPYMIHEAVELIREQAKYIAHLECRIDDLEELKTLRREE